MSVVITLKEWRSVSGEDGKFTSAHAESEMLKKGVKFERQHACAFRI